jgi:hypothetical protein
MWSIAALPSAASRVIGMLQGYRAGLVFYRWPTRSASSTPLEVALARPDPDLLPADKPVIANPHDGL